MSQEFRQHLQALQRRVRRARLIGLSSRYGLVALGACGTIVLLWRVLADGSGPVLAAPLTLVALAPVLAWLRTRPAELSARDAATWLDVQVGGGGDLVTALEQDDPRWTSARDLPDPPAIRWRPSVWRLVGGAAFLLLTLLVPIPASAEEGPRAGLYGGRLEDLREQLVTLQEELVFDDEEAAQLEEQLQRLEAEASEADNPEAMFESLDAFGDSLAREALEAQEAIEQATESLQEVAATADQDAAAAQAQLAETLEALEGAGLDPRLPSDLAEELGLPPGLEELAFSPDEPLDPDALQDISEELREALKDKLAELAEAGLLEELGAAGVEPGELAGLLEFDPAALEDLELCEDCQSGEP